MNAAENINMTVDTTLRTSWLQNPNHPYRLQAVAARLRLRRARSVSALASDDDGVDGSLVLLGAGGDWIAHGGCGGGRCVGE